MSLTVNQDMQAANNLNDLAVPGKDRVAVVEPANRFDSRDNTSLSLETLSIKAPPGFEGNITLVCDASGAVPAGAKSSQTNVVIKWKSGEKPAPRPSDGEYKIAMTRDGYYYWVRKEKTFLEPGEAKKLASATNAVPAVKSPAAVPTADKVSQVPTSPRSGRGRTWWLAGDPALPCPSPGLVLRTNNVGHIGWVRVNIPQGNVTEGYMRSGGTKRQ